VSGHSTLSRRTTTPEAPLLRRLRHHPLHSLVDDSELKLGATPDWVVERHDTSWYRSRRKLHFHADAGSAEIVAFQVPRKEINGAARTCALRDPPADPVDRFTADNAYDQDPGRKAIAERHSDAVIMVAPRATALPKASNETTPIPPDLHRRTFGKRGLIRKSSKVSLPSARRMAVEGNKNPLARTSGPKSGRRSIDTGPSPAMHSILHQPLRGNLRGHRCRRPGPDA